MENNVEIRSMSRNKAMLFVFIAALLWSTGGLLVKLIDANPLTISGYRALIALPVLLYLFPLKSIRFTKKVWVIAMFQALTGILYMSANKLTTAANAVVLQFIAPAFVILFSVLLYKDKVNKDDINVVSMSIFGIILFFFDELSPGNILGNFLAILSGVTNAAFFVAVSRSNEDKGTIMIAGQIETLIIALPFMVLLPVTFSVKPILALLALGLFQRGLSSVLFGKAAGNCSALDAMLISMAEPLFNPILVLLFLGEKPGKFALIGGLIVMFSVIIWNINKINSAKLEYEASQKNTEEI